MYRYHFRLEWDDDFPTPLTDLQQAASRLVDRVEERRWTGGCYNFQADIQTIPEVGGNPDDEVDIFQSTDLQQVREAHVFPDRVEEDHEDAIKHEIEHDLDSSASLTGHVGMPPHPWDEGKWIFPVDHPLRGVEVLAKKGDERAQEALDKHLEGKKIHELPRFT